MRKIAKADLGDELRALLDEVERGEEVVITTEGRTVARIIRCEDPRPVVDPDALVERMKASRKGVTLGGLSWKELRDEGRR